jgi:hypothetical protein
VPTFILVERIFLLMNLKLYFGMFSLSLKLFRVVVGKKLMHNPVISISRYFYVVGVTLTFAIMYTFSS